MLWAMLSHVACREGPACRHVGVQQQCVMRVGWYEGIAVGGEGMKTDGDERRTWVQEDEGALPCLQIVAPGLQAHHATYACIGDATL